jgi:16S rRNA G527 N7-methylase RsmG
LIFSLISDRAVAAMDKVLKLKRILSDQNKLITENVQSANEREKKKRACVVHITVGSYFDAFASNTDT